jgi:hypothetical protein
MHLKLKLISGNEPKYAQESSQDAEKENRVLRQMV